MGFPIPATVQEISESETYVPKIGLKDETKRVNSHKIVLCLFEGTVPFWEGQRQKHKLRFPEA